jgi:hypothetical protein
VPKTANASNSGVQARFIFMPSHSVQSKATPAAALQLRYSFIFLIDENAKPPKKNQTLGFKNCRSRNKHSDNLKCISCGFDLQKKHKRLPVSCIKFKSLCRAIIYIFFAAASL